MHAMTSVARLLRSVAIARALPFLLLASLATATTGCRKKASAKECEAMLDRFAELVVKERFADAGADQIAAERGRERKEAQGDDAFKNCTSEVQADELACAMKAETSERLIKCLE